MFYNYVKRLLSFRFSVIQPHDQKIYGCFLLRFSRNITRTIIRNGIKASIIDKIITPKITDKFIGNNNFIGKNRELESEKKAIKAINNII
jgi:hypothetical protein